MNDINDEWLKYAHDEPTNNVDWLKISEIFSSFQGEGASVGKYLMFIRLSGCNLKCRGKMKCDSSYHNEGKFIQCSILRDIYKKTNTQGICITGGEPMIQQAAVETLIDMLPGHYIEIETNGTITPILYYRYNVSPKLQSSGNLLEKRYDADVIRSHVKIGSIFKFVISDKQDMDEANKIIQACKIPREKVYLMPMGMDKDELNNQMVIDLAKEYGYNFSPRLQIMLWGKKKGV